MDSTKDHHHFCLVLTRQPTTVEGIFQQNRSLSALAWVICGRHTIAATPFQVSSFRSKFFISYVRVIQQSFARVRTRTPISVLRRAGNSAVVNRNNSQHSTPTAEETRQAHSYVTLERARMGSLQELGACCGCLRAKAVSNSSRGRG